MHEEKLRDTKYVMQLPACILCGICVGGVNGHIMQNVFQQPGV